MPNRRTIPGTVHDGSHNRSSIAQQILHHVIAADAQGAEVNVIHFRI